MQLAVGGVLSVVGVIGAHQWRLRRALPPPQASLDLGQTVHVQTWRDDGSARVEYRGTQWDAEMADAKGPRAETMFIYKLAIRLANRLIWNDPLAKRVKLTRIDGTLSLFRALGAFAWR